MPAQIGDARQQLPGQVGPGAAIVDHAVGALGPGTVREEVLGGEPVQVASGVQDHLRQHHQSVGAHLTSYAQRVGVALHPLEQLRTQQLPRPLEQARGVSAVQTAWPTSDTPQDSNGFRDAVQAAADQVGAVARGAGRRVTSGEPLPIEVFEDHRHDRVGFTVAVRHPAGIGMEAQYGLLKRATEAIGPEVTGLDAGQES